MLWNSRRPLLPLFAVALSLLIWLPAASAGQRHAPHKKTHRHSKRRGPATRKLLISRRTESTLAVTTTSPANGAVLSGTVDWRADVTGGTPTKVSFAVDGSIRWSTATAPFAYQGTGSLDTTQLANGSHALTVTASGKRGTSSSSKIVLTVSNAAPTPTPEPTEPAPTPEPVPTPPSGPIYWGAWIGKQLTGEEAPWDMNAVSQFEAAVGKPLSLVQFSAPFANCFSTPCKFYNLPTASFEDVRKTGAIPFFSWGSQSIPSSTSEPDYQLADVIAGNYDTYIRNFASAAKSWGHPFFLRFNWEMNGNWFPWSEGVNGNNAGEYVAAWRHVHDIFTSVGATNATWVWCPNVDPDNRWQGLKTLYPGNDYVDWTCLDGYNNGTMPSMPDRWRTFSQLFASTYSRIVGEIAPTKPMVLGEVASTEYGGSKASWIREMLADLPGTYPKVRGLIWFDKYTGGDWPIDSSSAATQAFAEGIDSAAYTTDAFSSLPVGTIQPAG